MSQRSGMSRRIRGFTLVELLVVIGIIALLVGILLPALNKARAQSNSLKCMANLKTIGQAVAIYEAENNQYFPMGTDGGASTPEWYQVLQQMMGRNNNAGAATLNKPAGLIGEAFICPSHTIETSEDQTLECDYSAHPRLIPRIMNGTVEFDPANNAAPPIGTGHHYYHQMKASQVPHSSDTIMVGDGIQVYSPPGVTPSGTYARNSAVEDFVGLDNFSYSGANASGLAYPAPTNMPTNPNFMGDQVVVEYQVDDTNDSDPYYAGGRGQVAWRHQQSANFVFCDGHVESFTCAPPLPNKGIPSVALTGPGVVSVSAGTGAIGSIQSYKCNLMRKNVWIPYR